VSPTHPRGESAAKPPTLILCSLRSFAAKSLPLPG
jgi:hypothetical protein